MSRTPEESCQHQKARSIEFASTGASSRTATTFELFLQVIKSLLYNRVAMPVAQLPARVASYKLRILQKFVQIFPAALKMFEIRANIFS